MTATHHRYDTTWLLLAGVLVVFGLLMLSSASAPMAYQKFGDPYEVLKHQFVTGVIPGLLVFWLCLRLPHQKLRRMAPIALLVSIGLLLLVFIPGLRAEYGSARSWITIFGFSLQPSEFVKLTFVVYVAAWLDRRSERAAQDVHTSLLPFVSVLGVIALLMLLQPDMGTLIIIALAAVVVYWLGGGSGWHLIGLAGAGGVVLAGLIAAAPYRLNRLTAFLHPENDPQGISYHIWQALIAVGSGGWFGQGFGHSRQKFSYLPEVTGDSIFAVMAEELGFVFTTAFVILFVAFLWRGIMIARNTNDRFSRLLVGGCIAWLGGQFFINIGAMLSLLPITGVPLPFVSAGGSALVAAAAAVGIIARISQYGGVRSPRST